MPLYRPYYHYQKLRYLCLNRIAGQEFLDNPNQNPLITNWNRVETAMPDIRNRFLDIVESDSKI